MTTRQELETRLATFAAANSLPVSYESVPFTKPTSGGFLECFIISAGTVNPTADARRTRERGTFQVNLWNPSGHGVGQLDTLAAALVAAFPVVPKTGTVSIEQTPNTGRVVLDTSGYAILPVTMLWRVEGTQ